MPGPETSSSAPKNRPTLLVERWRPRDLAGVVGQAEAVQTLRRFAQSWTNTTKPPKVRAALLEGGPGTGKTSAARALATEMGWGLIEMGASDARNEEAIQQVAGRAALTNTFSEDGRYLSSAQGGRNLILIDDADGISSGRGGSAASESGGKERKGPLSFREFLRARYREISALNEAWGLKEGAAPAPYASFAEVPTSGPRGGLGQRKEVRRDLDDFQPTTRRSDLTDKGGLGAVTELLRTTRQPILLTAIDPRTLSRASATFRTGVVHVRFYPVREESLRAHLHRVASEERIDLPTAFVETIVRHSTGDLRAALNDLELAATLHALRTQGTVPASVDVDQVLGWRDYQSTLFEDVGEILQAGRFIRMGKVMDRLNVSPDELVPWIEENLPRHARTPALLSSGFDMLARGEGHLARAQRWRIWTLWSYATEVMTGGVSLALHPEGPPSTLARIPTEFPHFLATMGGSRSSRASRDALVQKIGRHDHLSRRKARQQLLPFFESLYRGVPSAGRPSGLDLHHLQLVRVSRELELEARDLAYLLQVEEDHPAVQNLLQEEKGARPDVAAQETPAPRSPGKKGQRTLF